MGRRKISQTDKSFLRMYRADALIKQGKKCHYCLDSLSRSKATADHKTPVSAGGKTNRNNIIACCERCNVAKDSIEYDDFMDMINTVTYYENLEITLSAVRRTLNATTNNAVNNIRKYVGLNNETKT